MRIGRISGFELRVHWSTVAIFFLLVVSLSSVYLPDAAPGHAETAYVIAAAITGVAFYLALLAHEVSHAIVAKREGIEVRSLTLWMFGGIASLAGEPEDAGADLRIAGVGPAVSLGLGLVFGGIAWGLSSVGGPELVVATLAWLSGINVVLAAFNAIPAAPLDGGRILRAVLWRFRGDRTSAAITATKAGEAFGYVLAALGVVRVFTGAGFGGLWFIVLGWFLLNAARAERTQTVVVDALRDVRVRDVMTSSPTCAPDHITVRALLDDYVMQTRHSAFPLVDLAGDPAGLVTLDRIRGVPSDARDAVRVREVACGRDDVPVARPDEIVTELLPRLNSCGEGRALVMEGDRLVGIVTATDIARALERAMLSRPADAIDLRDQAGLFSRREAPESPVQRS